MTFSSPGVSRGMGVPPGIDLVQIVLHVPVGGQVSCAGSTAHWNPRAAALASEAGGFTARRLDLGSANVGRSSSRAAPVRCGQGCGRIGLEGAGKDRDFERRASMAHRRSGALMYLISSLVIVAFAVVARAQELRRDVDALRPNDVTAR